MKSLQNKVAVITGAASGLGREFARLAARERMRVALADVQRDALGVVVNDLKRTGAVVISDVIDVAQSAQVQRFAEHAFSAFGNVHLVINNAGVGGGGYIWENTARDWQWVMGVNLMGVVHGVQHFVPRMLEASKRGEAGHIVNTASVAGWLTAPLMGVYNVSKHAVVALSETLYHDLRMAQSSIGVSVLCPAFVPTGIAASHRYRPAELLNADTLTASQRVAQSATEKAVASGKITAEQIAQLTFDAVRENRFYVFTHSQILPAVRARFDAILTGAAPADPYALRPSSRPQTPA
jgi:NAD(P)-dependent dehydrogenase (short-subunit alcohol dehydrogenase family)